MPRPRRADSLEAFLTAPERPPGTFTSRELQGFLFAVATSPELIQPSEWLPEIFDGAEAGYADLREAQFILGEIMRIYNEVNAAVLEGDDVLPADCEIRTTGLENLDAEAPISQWSKGFVAGYQWLEETWDAYVPDERSEDFASLLLALGFFSSPTFAQAVRDDMEAPKKSLAELANTVREILPEAAAEFARLGRMLRAVVAEVEAEDHTPRRSVKVSRNAPCPCGSGKKFKKCCGATVGFT